MGEGGVTSVTSSYRGNEDLSYTTQQQARTPKRKRSPCSEYWIAHDRHRMARGKKVRTGGKSRGSTPRTPPSRNPQAAGRQDDSSDDYEPTSFKPFTLRDAGRRPQANSSSWNAGSTFRHQSIGFVRSVGVTSPRAELDDTTLKDSLHADSPYKLGSEQAKPEEFVSENRPTSQQLDLPTGEHPKSRGVSPEYTHQVSQSLSPRKPLAGHVRMPSPSPSDSGDEIVVFQGRNRPPKQTGSVSNRAGPLLNRKQPETQINPSTTLDVTSLRESLREPSPPTARDKSTQRHLKSHDHPGFGRAVAQKAGRTNKPRQNRKRHTRAEEDFTDEVIADYVQNMQQYGLVDDKMTSEMDTPALDGWVTKKLEWTASEIEDFDGFSTSDEVLEVVTDVLSKRVRVSGTQYLVVWDGQSIDDARWIQEAALTMQSALELIRVFEENEKNVPEYPQSSNDSSDEDEDVWEGTNDDASDDDDDDDLDSEEDERDLIERRIARMTDEQIARLLAKQEELGMGSDELLLFDDDGGESDEGDDGLDNFLAFETSKKQKGSRKPATLKKLDCLGSDDEVLGGGGYGAFDVMDHERPSLGAGRRGRKETVSFGLSDSELEQSLQATWAADRKRKSAKKEEREELRAQGLLGKKNKFKPDLNVKHRDGMSIDQIGQELEKFLSADHETMALPPMNKKDRKMMHEIAHAFNLKSKSAGKGKTRFPVLYKTSRTRSFNREMFVRVQAQLKRRFFTRMDYKGAPKGIFAGQERSGGFGGDISYREGEVVGGTAPELAADNRGRAMLEKMGWTTGTALGAMNNKGILVPVAHVIKKGKTGLG